MSLGLSILCVTQNAPRVQPILEHFREVGAHLDADVVILTDGVSTSNCSPAILATAGLSLETSYE